MARSRTKLKCINYKEKRSRVCGLQLVFRNGHESPLFERKLRSGSSKLHSIEIGQNKFIRQIHFKYEFKDLIAVRLIDSIGNFLDIGSFDHYTYKKITKHTIPEDEEIVGLKCAENVYSIGFICYKPRQ